MEPTRGKRQDPRESLAQAGPWRDQRGQTTVFFALIMMLLVCFLAFMVNVGQLVHDRILVQTAADMAALSAANVQAVGLNEIADLNWECQDLVDDLRDALRGRIWDSSVNDMFDYFKFWIELNHQMQRAMNQVFPILAHLAAQNTITWFNKKYGGGFGFFPLVHPQYPGFKLTVIEPWEEVFQYTLHIGCPLPCPPLPVWKFLGQRWFIGIPYVKTGIAIPLVRVMSGRTRKDPNIATYYRVQVWRRPRNAFVTLKKWGFDVEIPQMVAGSLAMPTGGSIDARRPTYVARFVPMRTMFNYDLPYIPFRFKYRH